MSHGFRSRPLASRSQCAQPLLVRKPSGWITLPRRLAPRQQQLWRVRPGCMLTSYKGIGHSSGFDNSCRVCGHRRPVQGACTQLGTRHGSGRVHELHEDCLLHHEAPCTWASLSYFCRCLSTFCFYTSQLTHVCCACMLSSASLPVRCPRAIPLQVSPNLRSL